MVNEKLIVAGFGGQGVLMIGKMAAMSGMENGKEVSWLAPPRAASTSATIP